LTCVLRRLWQHLKQEALPEKWPCHWSNGNGNRALFPVSVCV
jgi:hypothetical protein